MTRHVALSIVIALLALLTSLMVLLGTSTEYRPWLALPFLLLGPGLAAVRLLHFADLATTFTLAVAASLGIETLLTTTLLVAGAWSPELALALLVALTLGLLLFYHLTRIRQARSGSSA